MSLFGRLLVNAAALWAAIRLVPGVSFTGNWWLLFAVALVFGVLNARVRPILMLLTLPFFLVTLGLFTFVLNALMLWLTGALGSVGARFHVSGRCRVHRRPGGRRQFRAVGCGLAARGSRASANQVVMVGDSSVEVINRHGTANPGRCAMPWTTSTPINAMRIISAPGGAGSIRDSRPASRSSV